MAAIIFSFFLNDKIMKFIWISHETLFGGYVISKPVVSRFEEGAFVGILLLYLCFSLFLLQFQLIFVSFVIISAILCCFFKAMLIVRILF